MHLPSNLYQIPIVELSSSKVKFLLSNGKSSQELSLKSFTRNDVISFNINSLVEDNSLNEEYLEQGIINPIIEFIDDCNNRNVKHEGISMLISRGFQKKVNGHLNSIISILQSTLPVYIEVLSTEGEAKYGRSAVEFIKGEDDFPDVVVDIGSETTEVSLQVNGSLRVLNLDIGFKEKLLLNDFRNFDLISEQIDFIYKDILHFSSQVRLINEHKNFFVINSKIKTLIESRRFKKKQDKSLIYTYETTDLLKQLEKSKNRLAVEVDKKRNVYNRNTGMGSINGLLELVIPLMILSSMIEDEKKINISVLNLGIRHGVYYKKLLEYGT